MNKLSTRQSYWLLGLLILVWGSNWPVMKVALHYITPLWFCAARFVIGAACLFLWLAVSRKFQWPQWRDVPMIACVGIFQVGVYIGLITLALQHVTVGQSGILSYSTPIWLAPIAIFYFKEPAPPLKIMGLLLSFSAIVVLFNPGHHDWSNRQELIGNLELLLAAMCSVVSLLYIRFAKWHSEPIVLTPWQLLLGALICMAGAIYWEPAPQIQWGVPLTLVLFYTGIFASAFGYWCVMMIAKSLPAITTSLGLLGSPLLGLVLATVLLHEPFSFSLGLSLVLFFAGMVLVNIADTLYLKRVQLKIKE